MPFSHRPILSTELWIHTSRYVALEDAIVCSRVCKTWNDLFTSVVWHTIDFRVQPRRVELDPAAVKKHGHRVRIIKGIWRIQDLRVLHDSSVRKLQSLSIVLEGSPANQAYSFDLLRQNSGSLTDLEVSVSMDDMWSTKVFFPIDAISIPAERYPTLKLTHLKIGSLAFTRSGFASFLRMCPTLKILDILETTLYSDASCSEPYQHLGLIQLHASPQQVFQPDPDSPNTPSLLVHFPKLRKFRIWNPSDSFPPSPQTIGEEVARYCPELKEVLIEASASITTTLLTQTFMALTHIMVDHDVISTDVIMGILAHRGTLDCVGTFAPLRGYYEQSEVPRLEGSAWSAPGWVMQLVPQECSRLTTIRFPLFEMDMDDVEKVTWSCSNLEELFVRIKGLDIKDRIDRAIELWVRARRKSGREEDLNEGFDLDQRMYQGDKATTQANGNTIEERVARHLVRFERLQRVWLGRRARKIRLG